MAQQTVQLGWATAITRPKSEAGDREVPLDATTVAVLRKHRAAQKSARAAAGARWTDSGLVFTGPFGAVLHPDAISRRFALLRRPADLPPVQLQAARRGHPGPVGRGRHAGDLRDPGPLLGVVHTSPLLDSRPTAQAQCRNRPQGRDVPAAGLRASPPGRQRGAQARRWMPESKPGDAGSEPNLSPPWTNPGPSG